MDPSSVLTIIVSKEQAREMVKEIEGLKAGEELVIVGPKFQGDTVTQVGITIRVQE